MVRFLSQREIKLKTSTQTSDMVLNILEGESQDRMELGLPGLQTELAEAEATLEETEAELDSLAASKAELHAACDFVLKNFDYRQTARDQEIEALKQAKSILSGAKFNALLQSYGA